MTIDIDLLKRTMIAVEQAAKRGEWDQTVWRTETDCGTAYCFAGWVAKLEGREWVDNITVKATDEEVEATYGRVPDYSKNIMDVGEWAEWRLGLTQRQADNLFDTGNTLDDLRRIVANYCGRVETLEHLTRLVDQYQAEMER